MRLIHLGSVPSGCLSQNSKLPQPACCKSRTKSLIPSAFLNPVRVDNIQAIYITQLFNAGFECNQDDEIINFTVEMAGFNLPTNPEAYSSDL